MNNKIKAVFSGNCLLSKTGQETNLKGINGENIYTGDLVRVIGKIDYQLCLESIKEGEDEDGSIQDYINNLDKFNFDNKGLNVVVKDSFSTYTDGSVVKHESDNGWVFGWKNANMNDYHLFKVKDYSEIDNEFRYQNFRYVLDDVDSRFIKKEEKEVF